MKRAIILSSNSAYKVEMEQYLSLLHCILEMHDPYLEKKKRLGADPQLLPMLQAVST